MSKRAPGFERHPLDFYATPAKAVPPLVPFLRVAKVRRFSEPCAGDGALVRHLESFGLICAHASDVASGQDARGIPSFDSPVITNPPYERKLMHALIRHFVATAPCAWLLLEYAWTATKQAQPFLTDCCSDIVMVGRLRWIEGTKDSGKDDFAWLRFASDHRGPPILHTGENPTSARTTVCISCGRSFLPERSTAKFCSGACRQHSYRGRVSVTLA